MAVNTDGVLRQMDEVLVRYEELRSRSQYSDLSDLPEANTSEVNSLLAAAIERFAPPATHYLGNLRDTIRKYGIQNPYSLPILFGILKALRADYAAGRLQLLRELIHAEVFGDMLEMADHLLEEGYKDPAAVLAGGVLEEHLRKLCDKHGILTAGANGKPKKADAMNAELVKLSVYSKLDQKNVTAWLDLRNKAAHARYGEYEARQVSLMAQGIRDFITRLPA